MSGACDRDPGTPQIRSNQITGVCTEVFKGGVYESLSGGSRRRCSRKLTMGGGGPRHTRNPICHFLYVYFCLPNFVFSLDAAAGASFEAMGKHKSTSISCCRAWIHKNGKNTPNGLWESALLLFHGSPVQTHVGVSRAGRVSRAAGLAEPGMPAPRSLS